MLKGAITAIITPFKNGKINYTKMEELIEFQIANEIDGIVVCGTTGESATLSTSEKKKLIQFTVNTVNGRVPVIAGTGSNNTKTALAMSKCAEDVGADYTLVVSPYYNKTTKQGIISHYEYIADNTSIPLIMYNVPSRTGLNIDADTTIILSQHPNILGIKDASSNIAGAIKIISESADDFLVFSGNDDIIVPMLSIGSAGVISVISNILPKEIHDMCKYYAKGETEKSKALQLQFSDLISKLFIETNPIPIKEAMNILGFDVGGTRLPLVNMSKKNQDLLYLSLKDVFGF